MRPQGTATGRDGVQLVRVTGSRWQIVTNAIIHLDA
jgi:hypothetical protein